MANEDNPIGYKNPPKHTRFKEGQSGNLRGRPPKKTSNFLEEAAEILGMPVKGRVNGKSVTVPTLEAVFLAQCREALNGNNPALRRVIELMLALEPEALNKIAEQQKRGRKAKMKFAKMLGIEPDENNHAPK